ncbi:actin cortical patch SUR7/pH-response regulator pali [Cyathus striatus]|nr:actin cortical patch SUR7/pH-response regulator pali [Cyathus striatus]
MLPFFTPLLLFTAFLLLLLLSLSAPIIHSIYLFRLAAAVSSSLLNAGASAQVSFGVWGYCVSAIQISIAGIDRNRPAQCSSTHLGYTFDQTVAEVLNTNDIHNLVSKSTTAALVIHPIVAAFSFLALLLSLCTLGRQSSRLFSSLTLIICSVATVLTTIVFLIDVIFVAIVRGRVRNASNGTLSLNWGNAVWMALGATIALWTALFTASMGAHRERNMRRKTETY